MVSNVTSLTQSGLRDWLIQRVTAIVLTLYTVLILGFIVRTTPNYQAWHAFMTHPATRIASVIALLSILFHAWIGFWTVSTDYLKWTWLRLSVQVITFLGLLWLFIWGIMILWGPQG